MEKSIREKRIRNITQIYYSRPEIQKAIHNFCKNREISPRYFQGFGKRPDSFQYKDDIFELVKKGATSFHCSEEIWIDPLQISTDMSPEEYNEIRQGWDLLLDIDCKWFDYSKLAARAILNVLKNHNLKNIGLKFSGSKGWHIIIPWKAFPKEIGGVKTKDLFPQIPRKIINYIRAEARKELEQILPPDFDKQFKTVKIKKGIKCQDCNEIADSYTQLELYCDFCKIGEIKKIQKAQEKLICANCKRELIEKNRKIIKECSHCNTSSDKNKILTGTKKGKFAEIIETDLFDLMGLDLILVSPRHLFRAPFSLHEKTALASVVLDEDELENFELKDADPMKIKIKNFLPDSEDNEAKELVIQALDWDRTNKISRGQTDQKAQGKYANFKPLNLTNITEAQFPPCITNILKGIRDGKKRALFTLIHFFRSIGMDKTKLEKKIEGWNKKNTPPLKQGYILSQLSWAYKRKPLMPPNCKEFYQGIGVCVPDNLCQSIKNPVNYIVRKNFAENKDNKTDNKYNKNNKKKKK